MSVLFSTQSLRADMCTEHLLNKRASFSSTHGSSAYHCSTREGRQGPFKLWQKTYKQEIGGEACDRKGALGAWWPGW